MGAEKINHDGGLPPYRQLAEDLQRRIERAEMAKRLPSQRTLMQEYGVAQSTVRKAIALLREAGIVRTHKGWGTEILPRE